MPETKVTPLPKFAASLLLQVRAFGLLGQWASSAGVSSFLENHMIGRVSLLANVCDAVKILSQFEAIGNQPFIYNTASWQPDCEPAGWLQSCPQLNPHDWLQSLLLFWYLQLSPQSEGATSQKLGRAALWLVYTQTFGDAIDYLLDLDASGHVFEYKHTFHSLCVLMEARRRVRQDSELAESMLVQTPTDPKAWCMVGWRDFDTKTTPIRDLHDDFDRLIRRCEERIETVREAKCFDEWFIGQSQIHRVTAIVQNVLRHFKVEDSLNYRAFMARVEEIRADAGGLIMSQAITGITASPFEANFRGAEAILRTIRDSQDDWEERVFEERLLFPKALEGIVTAKADVEKSLPTEWKRFSAVLAPIVGPLILNESEPGSKRRIGLSRSQLEAFSTESETFNTIEPSLAVDSLLRLLANEERSERDGAIGMGDPTAHEDSSQSAGLNAHEQLFSKYTIIGGYFFPRAPVEQLLSLGWQPEVISKTLTQIHCEICLVELVKGLEEISQCLIVQDTKRLEEVVNRILDAYPYSDAALWERAVLLDKQGDHLSALTDICSALHLDPINAYRWQSFSVIATTLGASSDAAVAMAISSMLSS